MLLSVVIVSYNVKILLEQCIHTVQKALIPLGQPSEIIVVDNASKDNSVDLLKPVFPMIRFIQNKENLGFAKACNQGLEASSGKFILFLNPDTLVSEDSFQKAVSFFESHADAGGIGVRMINADGRYLKESKRGLPHPSASFYKLFGLASLFPRSKKFASYYQGHLDPNADQQVDVLSGAFMMIRRDVLDRIGGFDEKFFMYGEDIDLSKRIVDAGYRNYYLGSITIVHLKSKSTNKADPIHIKRFYDAMNVYVDKHHKGSTVKKGFLKMGIRTRRLIAKSVHLATNFFNTND